MIDTKELREISEQGGAIHPKTVLELLDELHRVHIIVGVQRNICVNLEADNRRLNSERDKLIRVLKEARAAIALEDARLESGELRLGQWTPLNGVREAVRDIKEIEV